MALERFVDNEFFVSCFARPWLSDVLAVVLGLLAAEYKLVAHLVVLVSCPLYVRRTQELPEHSMQLSEASMQSAALR